MSLSVFARAMTSLYVRVMFSTDSHTEATAYEALKHSRASMYQNQDAINDTIQASTAYAPLDVTKAQATEGSPYYNLPPGRNGSSSNNDALEPLYGNLDPKQLY